MEYAKNHIKTLLVFFILAVSIGGIIVLDQPNTQQSLPSTVSSFTPTPAVGSTVESRVRAGTIPITFPPTPTDIPLVTGVNPPTCSQSLAIDLLVDTSSSMKEPRDNPRIDTMKKALQKFITELPSDTLLAGQKFDNQARHIIAPIVVSQDNGNIKDAIRDLRPAGEGGTHIREGLEKAQKIIESAHSQYPNKKWNLILLTDGSPYPSDQSGEGVARALKNSGIRIITIGLDIQTDVRMTEDEIREYLKELASSPSDFYDATQDDLSAIYSTLSKTLCE